MLNPIIRVLVIFSTVSATQLAIAKEETAFTPDVQEIRALYDKAAIAWGGGA